MMAIIIFYSNLYENEFFSSWAFMTTRHFLLQYMIVLLEYLSLSYKAEIKQPAAFTGDSYKIYYLYTKFSTGVWTILDQ